MDGVLIVNKPKNYTSFDVVAIVRKIFEQKKVGHTGTLDPMAEGVLPILLGKTTKAQQFMKEYPKEYVASFRVGIRTDTQDITGKIINTSDKKVCTAEIKNGLNHFIGNIYQIPPMYSAIKKDGKKLCDLARKGISVEREKRLIKIFSIELINYDENNQVGKIKVSCSAGTYIRTLIDDLGIYLSNYATMTQLLRTKSNGFSIENSTSLEKLRSLDKMDAYKTILPTDVLFSHYDTVKISQAQKIRFKNGLSLSLDYLPISKDVIQDKKVYKVQYINEFVGLGSINTESHTLTVLKNF